VIGKELGFKFPGKIKAAKPYFLHSDGEVPKQSLFEFMSGEEFNETEKSVAWYLETQDKLFFWFRNAAKRDYGLQGWKKYRVYPDFIFTVSKTKSDSDCEAVFVVETKGLHLKNEDTDYKKSLFKLCNKPSARTDLHGLQLAFKDKPVNFEVVFENEWRRKFSEMMKIS
jgi:type III restriction enzyme